MAFAQPNSTTAKVAAGQALTSSGLSLNKLSGPGSSADVSRILLLSKQRQLQIEVFSSTFLEHFEFIVHFLSISPIFSPGIRAKEEKT